MHVPLGSWAVFTREGERWGARGETESWAEEAELRGACRQDSDRAEGAAEGAADDCSGHGVCVNLDGEGRARGGGERDGGGRDGAAEWGCMCSGNWIGRACNVSLDGAHEFYPRALPSRDPRRSPSYPPPLAHPPDPQPSTLNPKQQILSPKP